MEQSISGGAHAILKMRGVAKVPGVPGRRKRIGFALAAYNISYAHMLDAQINLTEDKTKEPLID